ncbi:hypothetical protein PMI16_04707 [Herbaspirillum sp. CF444]|uniref:hypothetical protein n=1 Tax=Herbaspirillum sp. CF444 TaxID=1144319 RepID=UPI0002722E21|nr:hypothetical protein [Herbaspirillum sp. CF444]EJL81428.1 hypothetical protein PMI16_04707 [Herbaspirillum sp. CF444]
MNELVYEQLIKNFEESLLTQLRGHNNEAGFLEMWVPDPDSRKSIANMVEAAEIYGLPDFVLTINQSSISDAQLKILAEDISDLADIAVEATGEMYALKFSQIGSKA